MEGNRRRGGGGHWGSLPGGRLTGPGARFAPPGYPPNYIPNDGQHTMMFTQYTSPIVHSAPTQLSPSYPQGAFLPFDAQLPPVNPNGYAPLLPPYPPPPLSLVNTGASAPILTNPANIDGEALHTQPREFLGSNTMSMSSVTNSQLEHPSAVSSPLQTTVEKMEAAANVTHELSVSDEAHLARVKAERFLLESKKTQLAELKEAVRKLEDKQITEITADKLVEESVVAPGKIKMKHFNKQWYLVFIVAIYYYIKIISLVIHYLQPSWTKTNYVYHFHAHPTWVIRMPLWAATIKRFWDTNIEAIGWTGVGLAFCIFAIVVYWKRQSILNVFRPDDPISSPIIHPPRPIASADQMHAFYQVYRITNIQSLNFYDTSVPFVPHGGGGGGKAIDADGDGIDDDIQRDVESRQLGEAVSNPQLNQELALVIAQTPSTPTVTRQLLGPVSPITYSLGTNEVHEFNSKFGTLTRRALYWDVLKRQLDNFYNPKAYLHERIHSQYYGQIPQKQLDNAKAALAARQHGDGQVALGLAKPIAVTNFELGLAPFFLFLGYQGSNTTLMVNPELLPISASASTLKELEFSPLRNGIRYQESQKDLEAMAQEVFNVANTQRSCKQPAKIRVRYRTIGDMSRYDNYYTSRLSNTERAWLEAAKMYYQRKRQEKTNQTASDESLAYAGSYFNNPNSEEMHIHNTLFDIRRIIERDRSIQMKLLSEGSYHLYKPSSALVALNITLSEPSYFTNNVFISAPMLTEVTEEISQPLAAYVIEAIRQHTAWTLRRQRLHDYNTGYTTDYTNVEGHLQFDLSYFTGGVVPAKP